jgi:hypothetical protein
MVPSSSHGRLPGALLAHVQDNRYGAGADTLGFCGCRLLEAIITGTRLDPLVAFAELGRIKLGERDLQAVLGRVAELATQTLPGMAGASVTLVESDRAFTVAFTGQLALDLDETQYQDGFGPCLEVAQSAGTANIPDMAAETRWPAFTRRALAAGVRSSLSVALPLQEAVLGALNIYATQPAIFDQDAIELARTRRPAALHPRAGLRTAYPAIPGHPPQAPRLCRRPRHKHSRRPRR